MAVFGPAASQLRKAISVQEADRLVSSLDREMTTIRPNESNTQRYKSGFDKAYLWLQDSAKKEKTILLYQYRGNPNKIRDDGSMEPYTTPNGTAGRDYVVQPMVRQRDDQSLKEDMTALDGPVYFVKMNQLIFKGGKMTEGKAGEIKPPDEDASSDDNTGGGTGSDGYPEATLAFEAEFFLVPNSAYEFIQSGGKFDPDKVTKPIFTNNMAVRR